VLKYRQDLNFFYYGVFVEVNLRILKTCCVRINETNEEGKQRLKVEVETRGCEWYQIVWCELLCVGAKRKNQRGEVSKDVSPNER